MKSRMFCWIGFGPVTEGSEVDRQAHCDQYEKKRTGVLSVGSYSAERTKWQAQKMFMNCGSSFGCDGEKYQ